MTTQVLLITLGHNSSAVLYDTGLKKAIGYEQERLTRIKGDSQFSIDAILEITKHERIRKDECVAYVSHWFPVNGRGKVDINSSLIPNCKYFTADNEKFLRSLVSDVVFCSEEFTHHDAHAYSVMAFRNAFSGAHGCATAATSDVFTIVADGFGNDREVLSIYKDTELLYRKHGYGKSLGLMYQFATSFTGMKENQDEYKFLGYESHVRDYIDVTTLDGEITVAASMLIDDGGACETYSPFLEDELRCLETYRAFWHNKLSAIVSHYSDALSKLDSEDRTFATRCIVGYFVQSVVERVILHYVNKFKMHDVNVAGGLFYNVKLNNAILTHIKGTFCPMPLAGDQGAAIGMAYYYNKSIQANGFNFGNLCWGKRSFYDANKALRKYPRALCMKTLSTAVVQSIAHKVANGCIVNIVGPDMEFGPRALCMTTTLFLPTKENTAANNTMNGRNEVMPCAPVCTLANAKIMFDENELVRTIGSDGFMICTHRYSKNVHYNNLRSGAMHVTPEHDGAYTGRPQIIFDSGHYMTRILNEVQAITGIVPTFLVNTSFNVHGQPIVFDLHAILENYKYQCEHAREGKEPFLYIFEGYAQWL